MSYKNLSLKMKIFTPIIISFIISIILIVITIQNINKDQNVNAVIEVFELAMGWIFLLEVVTFLLIIFVINKYVLKELTILSNGLGNFFDFITDSSKDVKPIQISNHDEIGKMAKDVNRNIDNI